MDTKGFQGANKNERWTKLGRLSSAQTVAWAGKSKLRVRSSCGNSARNYEVKNPENYQNPRKIRLFTNHLNIEIHRHAWGDLFQRTAVK